MNPAFEMTVLDWAPRPTAWASDDNAAITVSLSRHNKSPTAGLLANVQPIMGLDIRYTVFLAGHDGLSRSCTSEPNSCDCRA